MTAGWRVVGMGSMEGAVTRGCGGTWARGCPRGGDGIMVRVLVWRGGGGRRGLDNYVRNRVQILERAERER